MRPPPRRFTEVSFCASLGEPRSKARAIHIHRRVSRQSLFLACCIKHVTRGFVSRVSRSARERRERSASADELAQAQLIWLQIHSKDEFGKGWKPAKSSIRADLPLEILGKGVRGPVGWGGPTHSNWKCLVTSDCRDHRGRHDLRHARRRGRHAHHHRRRARRHNHRARRRRALPEDVLR
jgi:hypothetical protein